MTSPAPATLDPVLAVLDLLRCPVSGAELTLAGSALATRDGRHRYRIANGGIPLFAEQSCSDDGRMQQAHYDQLARPYVENLDYPHTEEYVAALDRALLEVVAGGELGTVAELCCGRGEAFHLLGRRIRRGVGVDVSLAMLEAAVDAHRGRHLAFVQGDATALPLASGAFDAVFMLGGIHHVGERRRLFAEVARILKPGGRLYFREPVNDLAVWRAIRWLVYRVSPALDHRTERPLRHSETVAMLEHAGLVCRHWRTHGLLGFCLFMNSDVLVVNRLFRFLPAIRSLARLAAASDEWILSKVGASFAGLQVIGVAEKQRRGAALSASSAGAGAPPPHPR